MKDVDFSLSAYSKKLINAIDSIEQKIVDKLFEELKLKIIDGKTIFIVGNGGSQANAHHITGDYLKTFALLKNKIKIHCLADNICFLTAASNDLSFQDTYALLVGTLISSDDLIIYLSGSGNSMNLIKTARKAKKEKIKQISVTAFTGGALKEIVDLPLHIKTNDMEIAEDCQLIIFHNLKQRLMKYFDKDNKINKFMDKYNKRVFEDLIS